ncbi:hypothetical protein F5144DRAFT_634905 [Chaetomium tenue]|uniref:Uncharacterized protein n=1 Tax=Chaetomium tenue TaxID=1854479 RepID=A0ACB7PN85_9PEZI|nr:hypothetical protein F5144DRAFT_634905 [Chaetomium globosum]
MPLMRCSPSPTNRTTKGHRDRKHQKRPAPGLLLPQQLAMEPIVWPAELTRQRHKIERHKISSGPASIFDLTHLFRLPLDIRQYIYNLIRPERYSERAAPPIFAQQRMRRAKHQQLYREVAHFLYRQTTFTFASFGELETFLDWINPETALSIRSVAFIAHMLPEGTEHCKELIKGHYFRGTGWDHVALFQRMPNLATLDIRFFPSVMLSFTTKFAEIMEPLRDLPAHTDIRVALPRMYYNKDRTGRGLPFVRDLAHGRPSFYSLTRAVASVEQATSGCEAYAKFFV